MRICSSSPCRIWICPICQRQIRSISRTDPTNLTSLIAQILPAPMVLTCLRIPVGVVRTSLLAVVSPLTAVRMDPPAAVAEAVVAECQEAAAAILETAAALQGILARGTARSSASCQTD